jgi:spermidine synthase
MFGFAVTVYAAAAFNFLIGLLAWVASGRLSPSPPAAGHRIEHGGESAARHRLLQWSVMVFVSGFLIISLEIVWFRVIGTLLHHDAYAFCLILGMFLVGDGLGIVAGAELAPSLTDPRRTFQLLQGAMGLYALASLAALFALTGYAGVSLIGVEGPLPYRLVFALVAVLPPAFLLGMSFPITQRAVQDDPAAIGRRVGLVQLCNILGNTAGAVVTGLVLLHWFGTAWTLRLIGIGCLAYVLFALWHGRNRRRDVALVLALAVLIALFPANAAFWSALHGTTVEEGAIVGEDRTGIAVLRAAGSRVQAGDTYAGSVGLAHDTLFISGHPQSRVPFLMGHGALGAVGALLHPDPQDILIIGQGTGGTPLAAGINPKTRNVRVVDIAAPVFDVMREAARRWADDALHRPLREYYADSRYTRVVADARHLLLTEETRYDIIEADAVMPTSALAGQLYSTDFFRLALRRLKPGGFVVQWVPSDRTLATFLRVFPYVVRINFMLIGSASPITIADQRLATAMEGPAGEYLTRMGWNRDEVGPALTSGSVQSWNSGEPRNDRDVNTDMFPKDEYHWISRKIDLIGDPG